MAKSVVLLSSGLDSTVNLQHFSARGEVALALTLSYGQRSAARELEHSRRLCQRLGVVHEIVELDFFKSFQSSSLFSQSSQEIPHLAQGELDSVSHTESSKKSVWVPNRNGLFLNLAACYAEEIGADFVVAGFNKEEAATFPDNSVEFLDSLNHSLKYSTRAGVRVQSCTLSWNKREIVQYGQKIGVVFEDIWPCYKGEENPCGECESCQRYVRATKGLVQDQRFQ